MKNILLVEDDDSLGETLRMRLQKSYSVVWAKSVTEAMNSIKSGPQFDLAILDVGLPDGTGFELAHSLKTHSGLQFLFLTAQADAESRLRGFELGAEEFIPKPFHLKELLLRIEHIFQKHETNIEKLELNNCVIDFSEMSIRKGDFLPEFPSANEMKVLKLLIQKSPQVLSRDEIMDAVWGVDKFPSQRTIDNIILHLRQLIGEPDEKCIRSVRGVGYQWLKKPGEI